MSDLSLAFSRPGTEYLYWHRNYFLFGCISQGLKSPIHQCGYTLACRRRDVMRLDTYGAELGLQLFQSFLYFRQVYLILGHYLRLTHHLWVVKCHFII